MTKLVATPQPGFTCCIEADLEFSAFKDAEEFCKDCGKVYAKEMPDPSKCSATGDGTKEAIVGKKAIALLKAVNFNDYPCNSFNTVVSFGGNDCRIEQERLGTYEISYQPINRGDHQLSIMVDGQHISGSPFLVNVRLEIEKRNNLTEIYSNLEYPCGMEATESGDILVAQRSGHCISQITSDGKLFASFGFHGSEEGQLSSPRGVTVDGEGKIIVTDYNNHRIQQFTSDGTFLKAAGRKGGGKLQFEYPCGIAYNATNNQLYVSDDNDRVQVLNSDLTFCKFFGKRGNIKGYFSKPRGISIDSSGQVYVADSGNHRIQVFSKDGKFLRLFSTKILSEKPDCPVDVAVTAEGFFYITKFNHSFISLFSPDGKFLTSFCSHSTGLAERSQPWGLAIDKNGEVYVCDSSKNCIFHIN